MASAKRTRRTLPSLDRVLANQIRELRRKQNVTQQQLADKLGETQSTIARIESGERAITVSEIFRIAAALDCAPVYLLSGGLTGDEVPVTKEHRITCAQAHEWIVGIWSLPGADRRAFLLENISAAEADEISAHYEKKVARAWLQPQADAVGRRAKESEKKARM